MNNEKNKKRPAPTGKKKAPPAREVIYTPPAPLNRKKLVLRLVTVLAVAVSVFLGCTVFFRVKEVVVTGNQRYTSWSIREASGIEEGESLLAFGKTKAAGRIINELRYIKTVRVGITLPDTVNIHVQCSTWNILQAMFHVEHCPNIPVG
jgi:cell division septal protein FtsQ